MTHCREMAMITYRFDRILTGAFLNIENSNIIVTFVVKPEQLTFLQRVVTRDVNALYSPKIHDVDTIANINCGTKSIDLKLMISKVQSAKRSYASKFIIRDILTQSFASRRSLAKLKWPINWSFPPQKLTNEH